MPATVVAGPTSRWTTAPAPDDGVSADLDEGEDHGARADEGAVADLGQSGQLARGAMCTLPPTLAPCSTTAPVLMMVAMPIDAVALTATTAPR